MPDIYFINPGLIDLDAAMVLGVNAKETPNAVGFFGTGLKYAISVLLRTGHEVSIWRGEEEFKFSAQTKLTRGKGYRQVFCNATPLGFTTDLGKAWEVWQALRELYSNCIDEGGSVILTATTWSNTDTVVAVSGSEILRAWEQRNRYFLTSPALTEDSSLTIHEGKGVFCKGILVFDCESQFAYNLKNAKLTEDRTLADIWSASYLITKSLLGLEDSSFMKSILIFPACWEQTLTYYPNHQIATATKTLLQTYHRAQAIQQGSLAALAASLFTDNPITRSPTSEESQMLAVGWRLLEQYGFSKIPVSISTSLPANILGMFKDGQIFITPSCFNVGQRCVTGTLLEESLHSRGLMDYGRRLQNFLIDFCIRLLEGADNPNQKSVYFRPLPMLENLPPPTPIPFYPNHPNFRKEC